MYRGERLETMDIHAMLRAVRAGKSNRYIADNLGVDRRTVSKYRQVFERQNLLAGELPELEQLNRLLEEQLLNKGKGRPSRIATWAQPIQHYVDRGLTPRLIYQKLCEDPRFTGSESAVYRYVRKLRPPTVQATIRVETAPGQEGQVDFGKVGKLWDGGTQTMRCGLDLYPGLVLVAAHVRGVCLRPESRDLAGMPLPCLRGVGWGAGAAQN